MPDHRERVRYVLHDNGIHEFVFFEASRKALDEWGAYLRPLFEQTPPHETLAMLIDITQSGMQPMRYAFQQAKTLQEEIINMPETRYAFLADQTVMTSLINTFYNLLRLKGAIQYFTPDQRATAIRWLLQETELAE